METKNYGKDGGSFYTRIYLGADENGKQKYKKLKAQTVEELQEKEAAFRRTMKTNGVSYSPRMTLKQWAERYLDCVFEDVENGDYQESEYKMLKARLNYFLTYKNGMLGRSRLDDILPEKVQRAINDLWSSNPFTEKPTGKRTLTRYLKALSNVFDYARRCRAYNYPNPCEEIKIPKKATEKTRDALSKNMVVAILKTNHRGKLAVCMMLLAGLRRGELTALQWQDVDLKKRIIHVTKSYDFKEYAIKDPKTLAGKRDIPISDYLFEMLTAENKNKKPEKEQFVIEKIHKGPMTHVAWRRLTESFLEAVEVVYEQCGFEDDEGGFEPFTLHQLRHTYCSMLQWSGVDIKIAQALMGHSDYGVTANIYTHTNEESKIQAVKKQTDYLSFLLK